MSERRDPAAALALAALLAFAPAGAGAAGPDAVATLARLYYELEVASYCGLVDEDVGAGFERQSTAALRAAGLTRAARDALRGKAWQAAHAEWQNRGLGGFRNWCRTEGAQAARRLRGHGEPAP